MGIMSKVEGLPRYIQQLLIERKRYGAMLNNVAIEQVAEGVVHIDKHIEYLLKYVQSIDSSIERVSNKSIQEDSKDHFEKIKFALDELLISLLTVEEYKMFCARMRIIIEDVALLVYCIRNNKSFRENLLNPDKKLTEEVCQGSVDAEKRYKKYMLQKRDILQKKAHRFLEENVKSLNREMKNLKNEVNPYSHGHLAPYSQSGFKDMKDEMEDVAQWIADRTLLLYTLQNKSPSLLSVFRCLSEILRDE